MFPKKQAFELSKVILKIQDVKKDVSSRYKHLKLLIGKDELENFLRILEVRERGVKIYIIWLLKQLVFDKDIIVEPLLGMYLIDYISGNKPNCLLLNVNPTLTLFTGKSNPFTKEFIPYAIFPTQIQPICTNLHASHVKSNKADPHMLEFILERAIWENNNIIWADDSLRFRSFELMFRILTTIIYESIFPFTTILAIVNKEDKHNTTAIHISPPVDIYNCDVNPITVLDDSVEISRQFELCVEHPTSELQERYICWILRYCCGPTNSDFSETISSSSSTKSPQQMPSKSMASKSLVSTVDEIDHYHHGAVGGAGPNLSYRRSQGNLSMIVNPSIKSAPKIPPPPTLHIPSQPLPLNLNRPNKDYDYGGLKTKNVPSTASIPSSFENESFAGTGGVGTDNNSRNFEDRKSSNCAISNSDNYSVATSTDTLRSVNSLTSSSTPTTNSCGVEIASEYKTSKESSQTDERKESPSTRKRKFIDAEYVRNFMLNSERSRINFVLNILSMGLKLPSISYEVKERIVQQIRSWLLTPDNRPTFMQDEPDTILEECESRDFFVQAGFQKCTRFLLCHVAQVFLIGTPTSHLNSSNLQNGGAIETTPGISAQDQYEVSKRVLNLFRQVVMATPLNDKTWKCIISTLLYTLKLLNERAIITTPDIAAAAVTPGNILKYGNHKLLGAFIQTLLVTFIKACLNMRMPKELWMELSVMLTSLIRYEDLFNEWAKTMDTLFRIYVKHVFELDLMNLPSDRLSEQKAKRRRGQQQMQQIEQQQSCNKPTILPNQQQLAVETAKNYTGVKDLTESTVKMRLGGKDHITITAPTVKSSANAPITDETYFLHAQQRTKNLLIKQQRSSNFSLLYHNTDTTTENSEQVKHQQLSHPNSAVCRDVEDINYQSKSPSTLQSSVNQSRRPHSMNIPYTKNEIVTTTQTYSKSNIEDLTTPDLNVQKDALQAAIESTATKGLSHISMKLSPISTTKIIPNASIMGNSFESETPSITLTASSSFLLSRHGSIISGNLISPLSTSDHLDTTLTQVRDVGMIDSDQNNIDFDSVISTELARKSLNSLSPKGEIDAKLPIMLGGTLTGWNHLSATILWQRMLRLLNYPYVIHEDGTGNLLKVEIDGIQDSFYTTATLKFKLRYVHYLSVLYDKLIKIRNNQYILLAESHSRQTLNDNPDTSCHYDLDEEGRIVLGPPFQDIFKINFNLCNHLVRSTHNDNNDDHNNEATTNSLETEIAAANLFYSSFQLISKQIFRKHEHPLPPDTLLEYFYLMDLLLKPIIEVNDENSHGTNRKTGIEIYYALLLGSALMTAAKNYGGGKALFANYVPGSLLFLNPLLLKIAITLIDFPSKSLTESTNIAISRIRLPLSLLNNNQTRFDTLNFLGSILIICLTPSLDENHALSYNHKNIPLQAYIVRYVKNLIMVRNSLPESSSIRDFNFKILCIKILTTFLIHIDLFPTTDEIYSHDIHLIPTAIDAILQQLQDENIDVKLSAVENLRTLVLTTDLGQRRYFPKILKNLSESIKDEFTVLSNNTSNNSDNERTQSSSLYIQTSLFCLTECCILSSSVNDRDFDISQLPTLPLQDTLSLTFEVLASLSFAPTPEQTSKRAQLRLNKAVGVGDYSTLESIYMNAQELGYPIGTENGTSLTTDPAMHTSSASTPMKLVNNLASYLSQYLLFNVSHYPVEESLVDSFVDELYEIPDLKDNATDNFTATNGSITSISPSTTTGRQCTSLSELCESPSHQFYILNDEILLSLTQKNQLFRFIFRDVCGKRVFYIKNNSEITMTKPFNSYESEPTATHSTIKQSEFLFNSPSSPTIANSDETSPPFSTTTPHLEDFLSRVIQIVSQDNPLYVPLLNASKKQHALSDKRHLSSAAAVASTIFAKSKYTHLRQFAIDEISAARNTQDDPQLRYDSFPSTCPHFEEIITTQTTNETGIKSDNHLVLSPDNKLSNPSSYPLLTRGSTSTTDTFYQCRQFLFQNDLFSTASRASLNLLHKSGQFFRQLKHLDNLYCRETFKMAVLYVGYGQEDKTSILSNEIGSPLYERFLLNLGTVIDINHHKGFTGGLMPSSATIDNCVSEGDCNVTTTSNTRSGNINSTITPPPLNCIYYSTPLSESVFHVSTLFRLQKYDSNPADLLHFKMKHIGNDEVHIVWSDHFRTYRRSIIATEFCDVLIIIYPISEYQLFSIRIFCGKTPENEILTDPPSASNQNSSMTNSKHPKFGPLFDGAIVDEACLAPLVRQTALNAIRYLKSRNISFQHNITTRANCISNIAKQLKRPTTFEDLTFSSFSTTTQSPKKIFFTKN